MPGENIPDWSATAASNATADSSINWAEGMARATVNDSARSMMAAHAKDRNLKNGSITTAGTANAQTFTSGLSYTSVPTGLRVLLKIGSTLTNTTGATLNMDGIGGVGILTQNAAFLVGGELQADSYAEFLYNGTNWILLRPSTSVANEAEMEAAASASALVTAGRAQFHPGAAKAWGIFQGSDGAVQASHNVTSVSRSSAGVYVVTIATDFTSVDYAVFVGVENNAIILYQVLAGKTATAFTIATNNTAGTPTDPTRVEFVCFGTQ